MRSQRVGLQWVVRRGVRQIWHCEARLAARDCSAWRAKRQRDAHVTIRHTSSVLEWPAVTTLIAHALYRQPQPRLVDPTFRSGVTIRALFATYRAIRRGHIRRHDGFLRQFDAGSAGSRLTRSPGPAIPLVSCSPGLGKRPLSRPTNSGFHRFRQAAMTQRHAPRPAPEIGPTARTTRLPGTGLWGLTPNGQLSCAPSMSGWNLRRSSLASNTGINIWSLLGRTLSPFT
jgi:hypothetical protein